jgi:hypothetical protein
MALLEDFAEELGEEIMDIVAGFRCFHLEEATRQERREFMRELPQVLYGRPDWDDQDVLQIANALAWFALESVAQEVVG